MQYIFKTLAPDIQPTGVFSKAVCSHVASQKAFAMFGMKAVAIEVNFMRDGLFMKELRRPGEVFSFAGLGCANVIRGGKDLAAVVASMEEQAAAQDIVVLQFFLNLDSPWVGGAVEHLRDKGYFLGGYMPRWFDTDGLLMQKVSGAPDWNGIQLSDAKARRILEMVRADWEQTRTQS